jgi:DNA segregation ATPase FtsK/SpoIIIE, S-DNA-T family
VSSILAAGKALDVLRDLKSTVDDLSARARKLNEEFRARTAKEQRRHEAAAEDQGVRLVASNAEAEVGFQTAKASAKARYEQRKTRIGKAYQASKEQGLAKVENRIGGRKYELQKRMLQAERDQDAGLASTAAHFEEFKKTLATEQERLAELERRAQRAFKGYGGLMKLFFGAYETVEVDLSPGEEQLLAQLRDNSGKAETELNRFRGFLLLKLFRYFPLSLVGFLFGLRYLGTQRARPPATSISRSLARGRRLHDACLQKADSHCQAEIERIKAEFAAAHQNADQQLRQALAEAGELRVSCRMKNDERTVHADTRNERLYRALLERIERDHHETLKSLRQNSEVRLQAMSSARDAKLKAFTTEHEGARRALESEWNSRLAPLYSVLEASKMEAEGLFPPWDPAECAKWSPPPKFAGAARFGEMSVDLAQVCEKPPGQEGLVLPGPTRFSLPLCLGYPEQGSILFETENWGHDEAIAGLNNIILRLLSRTPPGRLNFTILDPVGLGQNFAGVMHLADYEEQLINSRIWTQSVQIEEKLADLNEHMEKVIQMYLRNEYQTIAEYNEQAGVIAEKYYFLVVADFPANFTDVAAKRLLSIAASGARCGVYTLIHWDHRQPLPQDFIPDELRKSSFCLTAKAKAFAPTTQALLGTELNLEQPPAPEVAIEFVHRVGRLSRDSSRVEVPFDHVTPSEAEIWSEETSSELRVPIGRTGATKLQYLAIGKGTRQHGLVAGKTGSGKSTLFHVIVTNLALWCSPEQVEFYLVDFKKGVEFKCYAAKRLPHARVVAIESDREFGLSVLQRVDEELKRRGDLFRQLGVQDVAGYKRAGGTEEIPRTLLMVDEFQEFFVEDDKIAQTASLLLDRIVRQGRAFGIHVILGSQTLGGAYTVARTTLGQMVIRIALQCNEADAYLIMDDNNPAPRLLSRPGEGIYNDMAGALEGNSPFQTVWLPEEVRDSYLGKVRARADQDGKTYPGPIVFEGNAPADIRENSLLNAALELRPAKAATAGRIWLGAPNSIKGPTEAVFYRQSGNNLLLVGQREEAILAIFSVGLIALAAEYPADTARIILCDATPPGTRQREFLDQVVHGIPSITMAKQGDLPAIMKDLAAEKKRRAEDPDPESAPPVFLFIHGLQRFGKLRYEEDFSFSSSDPGADVNPGAVLNDLICEGARLGFHVIAACDTYNNVVRFMTRKALSEFEMRVLFQMSANDSASLIDNPKAGMLGLHRALFFNAQEGYLETFRPYALPSFEWVAQAAQKLLSC